MPQLATALTKEKDTKMNVKRLIAQAAAALFVTAIAVAFVPSSAQAYGIGHRASNVVRSVPVNYWHHHRHHHHHHHGPVIVL